MASRMLENNPGAGAGYNIGNFEAEFMKYFNINGKTPVKDSGRIVYLMGKKVEGSEQR